MKTYTKKIKEKILDEHNWDIDELTEKIFKLSQYCHNFEKDLLKLRKKLHKYEPDKGHWLELPK